MHAVELSRSLLNMSYFRAAPAGYQGITKRGTTTHTNYVRRTSNVKLLDRKDIVFQGKAISILLSTQYECIKCGFHLVEQSSKLNATS